jgi:type I pantothenate kinase
MPRELSQVLSEMVLERYQPPRSRRFVVGIGGSVAVGKSTVAHKLVASLVGVASTVIGTDGFLFSNDALTAHGSLDRKGEPDTYDEDALLMVLAAVRAGERVVAVPTYSHTTFDVGPVLAVSVGDVVIVEGVNALQPRLAAAYDVAVFLDAPEPVLIRWYVDRFLAEIGAAEENDVSFYRRFVFLGPEERIAMAEAVWHGINAPNLRRFIAPTRDYATVVVTLDAEHQVVEVAAVGQDEPRAGY